MISKTIMARLLILLVFACCVPASFAQPNKSPTSRRILWSLPEKTFSIVVPFWLKEVNSGMSDSANKDAEGYERIRAFARRKNGYVFEVLILDRRTKGKPRDATELGGLEFVLGGDNDHDFTETYLRVNGLPAREVIYKNQNTKGLMIDTSDQIYVLGLRTKDRKNLTGCVAKQFFGSFHLLKQKV